MEPIVVAVFSGLAVFIVNLIAIAVGVYKLGGAVAEFKLIGHQQAQEIAELKIAVRVIADLITKTAVQTGRIEDLEKRETALEKLIDDLRRGEGYILPFKFPGA